jgi:hypothetical protein
MRKSNLAPLSCKNSEIHFTGKVNKYKSFFEQIAVQARNEKEKQNLSYNKRKNSSHNNSVDKQINNSEIRKSPSGKNLPSLNNYNQIVCNLQYVTNPDTLDQSRLEETINSTKQRRSTIPIKRLESETYGKIFEPCEAHSESMNDNKQDNSNKLKQKLQLNIKAINNDDEEEPLTQRTNLDTIQDSLKKSTPTNHDIIFKYNREFDNYDVIPLFKYGFTICGKENFKTSNYEYCKENGFEINRDVNKIVFNTIETQSDLKADVEKSPFYSDSSILDNQDFDWNIHKLKEKVIRKWNKENDISKENINVTYGKNSSISNAINKSDELEDSSTRNQIIPSKSCPDIEFHPISIIKEYFISKITELNIPFLQKNEIIELKICPNAHIFYDSICLNNWEKYLKIESTNQLNINIKDIVLIEEDQIPTNQLNLAVKNITSLSESSFFVLGKKSYVQLQETHELFSLLNSKNNLLEDNEQAILKESEKKDDLKIPNKLEIHYSENIEIYGISSTTYEKELTSKNKTIEEEIIEDPNGNTEKSVIKEYQIYHFDYLISKENLLPQYFESKLIQTDNHEVTITNFELTINQHKIIPISDESTQKTYFPYELTKFNEFSSNDNTKSQPFNYNQEPSSFNKGDLNPDWPLNDTNTMLNPSSLKREPSSSIENSYKDSGSTSPEKVNLIQTKEVKQFNLIFEKNDSDYKIQTLVNSITFLKEEKEKTICQVEDLSIFKKEKQDMGRSLNIEFQIIRKEKKYILVEQEKLDIWRSFKLSLVSMIILMIILSLELSVLSHINIAQNFSKNYFSSQSLFKWELIYSEN